MTTIEGTVSHLASRDAARKQRANNATVIIYRNRFRYPFR